MQILKRFMLSSSGGAGGKGKVPTIPSKDSPQSAKDSTFSDICKLDHRHPDSLKKPEAVDVDKWVETKPGQTPSQLSSSDINKSKIT